MSKNALMAAAVAALPFLVSAAEARINYNDLQIDEPHVVQPDGGANEDDPNIVYGAPSDGQSCTIVVKCSQK